MSIAAAVSEVGRDGNRIADHGTHEFVQLPAPGDRVVLPHPSGGLTIVRVEYVEHRLDGRMTLSA